VSVLAAHGLGVRFGDVVALDGVDLEVADGEFVAVVGPSGCGKSTLLRALGGMLPPGAAVSGTLALPTLPDGGRATAWMPQRDGLLPWRRAWSNALLGARIARIPRPDAEARAAELFETFGLAGFERAWPHELSGGMRQRLALLRTCLTGRPVLLLDEPFGALDPITRRRMNEWLAGVGLAGVGLAGVGLAGAGAAGAGFAGEPAGSAGPAAAAAVGQRAVVLVTHDVDEALALADRVVVLSARPGRVVLDAASPTREEILAALEPLPR
jgi:ABC-type nitrate/sulfonate/bicarbonate transport system ATPase subunit